MVLYDELTAKIEHGYTDGVTLEEAEKLAGEFLHAQLFVSVELKKIDLDRRMRKTGVKAIRAVLRLEMKDKADQKLTEATLDAMVDSNKLVTEEQDKFDTAEASKEELERIFGVFREAHIYYRGISKGRFE